MKQYTDLLRRILEEGRRKVNRTGTDTISLLGPQMEFDLSKGYPLEDLRPIFFRGVLQENLWFLKGECNNEALAAVDVNIWSKWALAEPYVRDQPRQVPDAVIDYQNKRIAELPNRDELDESQINELRNSYVEELRLADERDHAAGEPTIVDPKTAKTANDLKGGFSLLREHGIALFDKIEVMPKGYLGPIYGVLWRNWLDHMGRTIDQVQTMIDKLSSDNPKLRYSRCNIVTAFQPGVLPDETVDAETNIKAGRQALAACHTFYQLFAEPLTLQERIDLLMQDLEPGDIAYTGDDESMELHLDEKGIPRDQLSLKLYQRKQYCALAA